MQRVRSSMYTPYDARHNVGFPAGKACLRPCTDHKVIPTITAARRHRSRKITLWITQANARQSSATCVRQTQTSCWIRNDVSQCPRSRNPVLFRRSVVRSVSGVRYIAILPPAKWRMAEGINTPHQSADANNFVHSIPRYSSALIARKYQPEPIPMQPLYFSASRRRRSYSPNAVSRIAALRVENSTQEKRKQTTATQYVYQMPLIQTNIPPSFGQPRQLVACATKAENKQNAIHHTKYMHDAP